MINAAGAAVGTTAFIGMAPSRAFRNKGVLPKQETSRLFDGLWLIYNQRSLLGSNWRALIQTKEQNRRCAEVTEALFPTRQRLMVLSPNAHLKILIKIGRSPSGFNGKELMR